MGEGDELWTAQTLDASVSLPTSFGGGRYVPTRILGVGGQKIVYLVDDTKLDRRCALAFIADATLEAAQRDRFEREARAMARLAAHANVVALYDIGDEGGRPFIVSELVPGGDLRALLRTGPLPVERAVAITRDVLEALAFVHKNGLVHRDLKPENVWLTDEGRAKLGDFGIALVADRPRLSVTGSLLGTPQYMAPEQLRGERVDGRADLYSLGAMLHELVTGKPLFDGPVMAVLSQQMYAPPMPASEIQPGVPKGLDAFILRLLEKSAEARPASAEVARAELDRAIASAAAPATPHDPLRALFHAEFVGREAELATLKAAFERALQGRLSLALLVGEPGIGKTRLTQELALHARLRGARVLVGRCSDAEGTPPYLPFIDAIDAMLAGETLDSLRTRLGDDAAALRELLPRSVARLADVPAVGQRIDRRTLFQAMTDVLGRMAGGHGLLLILEDLHWADKASLLLLKHLVENADPAPIAILATYRDVEVGRQHPLSSILTDLRRSPAVERIPLRGLGEDHVRALLASVSQPAEWAPDLIPKLWERTEGNPLFVQEVLKQLLESGGVATERALTIPEGIRDVIGQRLSRLGEPCNRMLARAAIIGATFSWDVLAAVADQDEDTLLDLLDEALASQIIRERKQGARTAYEFGHALIRDTLYEEINAPRRARLHRQVGEAIERLYRSSLDAHVDALAHHFFQSGTADKAIDYGTRAGDRAVAQIGYEEALAHYARALEMVGALDASEDEQTRRCELHARRAYVMRLNAAHESARGEIDRAIELAPSDARRAELLVERAATFQMGFDVAVVGRIAEEILGLAAQLGRPDLEGAGHAWRAVTVLAGGNTTAAIAEFERGVALAGVGEAQLFALSHLPLTLYWVGRYAEGLEYSRRILEGSRRASDASGTLLTLPHRAMCFAALGRYGEALATFKEGRELGERHGMRPFVARVVSMCGGTYLSLFDFEKAEELAVEARAIGLPIAMMPPVISSGFDLIRIAARCGELARARAALEEITKPAEAAGSWHGWIWKMRLEELRAEIALRAGDHELAIDSATRALERATQSGRVRYRILSRSIRGSALVALGRDPGDDFDVALADARAMVEPTTILQAMRASLAVRPDDALLTEARQLVHTIAAALPDGVTRARFLERAAI